MVRLNPRTFNVVDDGVSKDHAGDGARDHVGLVLREARENTGRDLRAVSTALRIRYPHLLAIENGRFGALPGPTYAVGFVRTYAEFLGLPAEPLVERFKAETEGIEIAQQLDFPTPVPEGRFPGGAVVTFCAVVAAIVVGGWYYMQGRDDFVAERVPPPPASTPGGPPAAIAATVTPPATPAIEPYQVPVTPLEAASTAPQVPAELPSPVAGAATIVEEHPAPSSMAASAAEAPPAPAAITPRDDSRPATQVGALPAVPTTDLSDDGRSYGAANRDARIVLRATADSWVQVRDHQQNVLLTRMLHAGDSYRVPNRDGLLLLTGNAGGLSIVVDGAPVPVLGGTGVVMRDVPLDPASLQRGAGAQ